MGENRGLWIFLIGLIGVFMVSNILLIIYGVRAERGKDLNAYDTFQRNLDKIEMDRPEAIGEMGRLFEAYLDRRLKGKYIGKDIDKVTELLLSEKYLSDIVRRDIRFWLKNRNLHMSRKKKIELDDNLKMKDEMIRIVDLIHRAYIEKELYDMTLDDK